MLQIVSLTDKKICGDTITNTYSELPTAMDMILGLCERWEGYLQKSTTFFPFQNVTTDY